MDGSLETICQFLYGNDIPPSHKDHIRRHGISDGELSYSKIRSVIGVFDRQSLNTPIIVRFGPEDIFYADLGSFSLAVDNADRAVGLSILHSGIYEPHVTAFCKSVIKEGMHVVDIGANIGYFTLLSSRLVGPSGSVTAIEPNSENSRLILLSIERNGIDNVKLLPVALSSAEGAAYFSTHVGSNGGLLPETSAVLSSPYCTVVPVFRLDQLVQKRIDFIKVDVEGAESKVFDGAWPLIERDRPIISTEFSPEMLQRISGVDPLSYLKRFVDIGYHIGLLDRADPTGAPKDIGDAGIFLQNYGANTRLEDLALIPRERLSN